MSSAPSISIFSASIGVDAGVPQHIEQRLARHVDPLARTLSSVMLVEMRAAAVAVIDHKLGLADAIGDCDRQQVHFHGRICREMKSQAFENAGLRLDREDTRCAV